MGLSDEERLGGMTFSVYRLNKLYKELAEERKKAGYFSRNLIRILSNLKNIWHDLIGSKSNGVHWIIGSDSTNVIRASDNGLWALALKRHAPKLAYEAEEFSTQEERPMDSHNFLDAGLSIPRLLERCYEGRALSLVYRIFSELETTTYYLRRYKDKLSKSYLNLDKKISTLQGECFSIMVDNPEFTKAYILHRICVLLFDDEYYHYKNDEDRDIGTILADKEGPYLGIPMDRSVKELSEIHLNLVKSAKKKDLNHLMNRLLTIIDFASENIGQYKHIRDDIMGLLKKSKKFKKKNLAVLTEALEATIKVYEAKDKKIKDEINSDEPRDLGIYKEF